MSPEEKAKLIFDAGIEAVKPDRLIKANIKLNDNELTVGKKVLKLQTDSHIFVIGFGKASGLMAAALEEVFGNRITAGHVTVKYGHPAPCKRITVSEAGHPVPDANSLRSTEKILEIAGSAREQDIVFCLISGGGSALFEKLPDNISLTDLQDLSELLVQSGADISAINTVRKQISLVKGGQLANIIHPAKTISLILSDVVGDSVETIASGPTAPNRTNHTNALSIIKDYGLAEKLPVVITEHLQKNRHSDTSNVDVINLIIGNNKIALQSAVAQAEALNYEPVILTDNLQGDARLAAEYILNEARRIVTGSTRPVCLLMGGETTVKVTGNGVGGRNMELALWALSHMTADDKHILIASCGTDGTDGPTDAAGAIANATVIRSAIDQKLDPATFLAENDSYTFFAKCNGLIQTGPTGTNVMDIVLALIDV